MSLVEVNDLSVNFKVEGGVLEAVRQVSFHIDQGETLALVGSSATLRTRPTMASPSRATY